MEGKILVAYGSKYGATAEIAQKIGEVLKQEGIQVDITPAERVTNISQYKAVVLGSAVYIGKWMGEAADLLRKNERTLSERPVWLFSSGPTGEGDPIQLMKGWTFPENLKPFAGRIHPREIVIFHGMINLSKMNFFERFIIKRIKAQVGDFRNWDMITAWAKKIADTLKSQG